MGEYSWQGRRVPVLFKGGSRRVRSRFHLFVSDVNKRNEGPSCAQKKFFRDRRDGKILLASNASCWWGGGCWQCGGVWECLESVIADLFKVKIVYFKWKTSHMWYPCLPTSI